MLTTTTGRARYDAEASGPLELRDYLDVIRRRFVLIAVIALLAAGVAFLYANSQPNEYSATASILVQPIQVDLAETSQRRDQLVNMFTEREVVRSAQVAAEVSARVEGAPPAGRLQENVTIVVVDETTVMRITYTASTPRLAQEIAQSFADVYLEQRDAEAQAEVERRGGDLDGRLEDALVRLERGLEVQANAAEGTPVYINASAEVVRAQADIERISAELADLRGLSVDGGSVISPAELPRSPANLDPSIIVALGLAAGFIVGVPVAFIRDGFDDRIRSDHDLERNFGRPVLGTVPGFGGWLTSETNEHTPTILRDPGGAAAESFRRLRSTLLAVSRDESVSSILVTSSVGGEGAPNVAVNLAAAFAQAGTDTLLISANFRDSQVDELLGIGSAPGLGDVLLGLARAQDVTRFIPGVPDTLRVIPSGADLDNPADALDSPIVEKVVGGFDVPFEMLIVEAPPVTTAADALSLAQLTGGVVLCVRSWSSYLSVVDDTMNQLAQVRANVLGIMMT
jgi:capsular exopolysaccharide synthesis family protein